MLATAYLGLVFFILFIEIAREKTSKIDFLTFFNIAFSLLYPIPAFFLEANFDNSNTTMMFGSATYKSSMTTALAIFAGYFIVIIGFYSSSAKKFASTIQLHTRKNRVAIGYAIILLLISCVSIHIYSSQYGNLVDALSQSILIRSNAVDSGSFVFVKHFILTSFFCSYILASFSLSISKINISKKILIRNLFFISVLISLTAAILHAGRTNFAYYIASFYCAYVVQGKKVPLTFVIPSLCLVIFLVLYGKQFFFSLTGIADGLDAVTAKFSETTDDPAGDSNFSFYDFIANFVYPVHSLSAALDTEYEWRLFGNRPQGDRRQKTIYLNG